MTDPSEVKVDTQAPTEPAPYAKAIQVQRTSSAKNPAVLAIVGLLVLGALGGAIAGIVVAVTDDDTSHPSSPPPPPPPLPPTIPGAVATPVFQTVVSFTASGSPSDYDYARIDGITRIIATTAAVSTSSVSVTVTAASVNIEAVITSAETAANDNVTSSIRAAFGNATTAAMVLGVTMLSAPIVSTRQTVQVLPTASATPLGIIGSWHDGWSDVIVTSDRYVSGTGISTILGYGTNYMYLQQGVGTWSPGTFQKISWTWNNVSTEWHMCTTTFGHTSYEAMLQADLSTHVYNATHSICGTFSNTRVLPIAEASNFLYDTA